MELLSTGNEYRNYCSKCRQRYNDQGVTRAEKEEG